MWIEQHRGYFFVMQHREATASDVFFMIVSMVLEYLTVLVPFL